MARTFHFDAWLKGTPEQQKAEDERQALAMASLGRGHLSEAERLIGRGRLLEQTARGNLEASRGRDKEARAAAQNDLADALALQGRFGEAAKIHTEKHRRKYFRDIDKAIAKPDSERCKCSDGRAKDRGVEFTITPRFERQEIFSAKHGETVSVVECSKCGSMNARPLRSRLLIHKSARAGMSDVQVLNGR